MTPERTALLFGFLEFLTTLVSELVKGLRSGNPADMPTVNSIIPEGQNLSADDAAERLKDEARRYFEGES